MYTFENELKPIIGITMGDPAGIGPEISVKALNNSYIYDLCRPLIIGDASVISANVKFGNPTFKINRIDDVSQSQFSFGTIDVFDLANVNMQELEHGRVSAMAGNAAFEAVKKVIELALDRQVDATVTGPINKESINLAGHQFSGHTEIYAYFTSTEKYAMLLVLENLRVIHVSTHVSLRQSCDLVKTDRILEVIQLLDHACRQFGVDNPKIGVAGLNPHAGDGGLFGNEEETEIRPAIIKANELGILAEGPVPADTLFSKAKGGFYDGCVAMFHDQGHIPFKLEGFIWDEENDRMESVQGVNITLGLPIIRSSVDHGTAFEIAGKGVASADALLLAIEYAVKMAQNKSKKI